ncbi:MAG TPA: undecaprenyldiphospho-muramoylpentapeptide beta-N-acetylglucosaminyltransferase [Anaerolineae bacterium]|nr:undecaprenyldiphospho-muramoylpentapeptide beta-N-acetylglucosaminyltransferase [Anaerolineae bacterium]
MISGGGTGGHVYPALAVVEALEPGEGEIRYLGSAPSIEAELVARAGLPFVSISAAPIRGRAPWTVVRNLIQTLAGVRQALREIEGFGPEAIFVTGGYVSVPVVVAGWLRRVPILIYLPDIEPGLAVRVLSRLARRVAVSVEESQRYFPAPKTAVTGYPVRSELLARIGESANQRISKGEARRALGLEGGLKTLLVYGGSRGARSINLALSKVLDRLLDVCQIVHICGRLDAHWVEGRRAELPVRRRARYRPYAYLHEEMPLALAAADLVVARAGAATLGELPALGLPSILVPYPYAGRHQELNADYLVSHGAAVKIDNADLEKKLLPTVLWLLSNEELLIQMGERARRLARPEAARRIADELRELRK